MVDFDRLSDHAKQVLDVAAIATAFGTLIDMLPAIAALLSILWTVTRLLESKLFAWLLRKIFGVEWKL